MPLWLRVGPVLLCLTTMEACSEAGRSATGQHCLRRRLVARAAMSRRAGVSCFSSWYAAVPVPTCVATALARPATLSGKTASPAPLCAPRHLPSITRHQVSCIQRLDIALPRAASRAPPTGVSLCPRRRPTVWRRRSISPERRAARNREKTTD